MRTLQLGQKWPDGYDDNRYWIGANALQARVDHGDGLVILGVECQTMDDIERVAEQIRHDLDLAVAEARRKFGTPT